MEAHEKILTIAPAAWCDEAAAMLARTLRGVPCFTVDDYAREIESNADCHLYRVADGAMTVGYAVLRIERYGAGAEGVILAAAGRLEGVNLYGQLLPTFERMFHGVTSYRVDSCRSAGVLELLAAGYLPTHFVMRKAVAPGLAGDDLLEQLEHANCEVRGGPDLRSRPGRLRKGGGSSSSSSTTQTTNQVDRRQVVDAGSVGVSSDTSTVNVSVLDQGAIARAGEIADRAIAMAAYSGQEASRNLQSVLDLITASDQETGKSLSSVLGFARDVFVTGIGVLDKAGDQIDSQTALVARAYDNAQGEGTQKNMVAAAALAAVAIVAVKVWGK